MRYLIDKGRGTTFGAPNMKIHHSSPFPSGILYFPLVAMRASLSQPSSIVPAWPICTVRACGPRPRGHTPTTRTTHTGWRRHVRTIGTATQICLGGGARRYGKREGTPAAMTLARWSSDGCHQETESDSAGSVRRARGPYSVWGSRWQGCSASSDGPTHGTKVGEQRRSTPDNSGGGGSP
jgi:hypothetical protein